MSDYDGYGAIRDLSTEIEQLRAALTTARGDLAQLAQDSANKQWALREKLTAAQAENAELRRELEQARAAERAYDDLVGDLEPPDILVHWLNDRRLLAAAESRAKTPAEQAVCEAAISYTKALNYIERAERLATLTNAAFALARRAEPQPAPCSHCGDVHASDLACHRNKGRRKPAPVSGAKEGAE